MKAIFNIKFLTQNIELLEKRLSAVLAGSVILKMFALVLSFVISIILGRTIGPDGLGVFSFCIAFVGIASIPARLGIPTVVMREISRYRATQNYSYIKGVIRFSHMIVIGFTILVLSVLIILANSQNTIIDSMYEDTLEIAGLIVIILPLISLRTGILQGLNKVVVSTIPESLIKPLLFILMVAAYFSISGDMTTSPVIMMRFEVFASLLSFVVGYYLYRYYKPSELDVVAPSYEVRKWFKSVVPFVLMGGIMMFNQSADIILLGYLSTAHEVGYYKVGYGLATLMLIFHGLVGGILSPRFSVFDEQGDVELISTYNKTFTKLVALLTVPIVALLLFFGDYIINTLYGTDFISSNNVIQPLLFAYSIMILFGFSQIILNMSDNQKYTTICYVVAAVINIVLNILLIPRYGAFGASVATATSFFVLSISTWAISIKIMSINSSLIPNYLLRFLIKKPLC